MPAMNMDNKLGALWNKNVRKLLIEVDMTATDLAKFGGSSESTMQSCFGGNHPNSWSSAKTIAKLEKTFRLDKGALSSSRFNPKLANRPKATEDENNIAILEDKLDRIRRILDE